MGKIGKSRKYRKDKLAQLAQVMVCCAGPSVYLTQSEGLQQPNSPTIELAEPLYIIPEQMLTLARIRK